MSDFPDYTKIDPVFFNQLVAALSKKKCVYWIMFLVS